MNRVVEEVSAAYLVETVEGDVPVGYKKTEVGVVPEDWEIRLIEDIALVFSGGTPNRDVPEYWGGDIPWITTALIGGREISTANEFITAKGFNYSATRWCKAGTILMAMYGQGKTRGKTAMLSIDATINQACAAIVLKDFCCGGYVLQTLQAMYDSIRELSNSGGQENLSSSIIKRIPVLLPPVSEQNIIGNALSDVDSLVVELEKLIAKKQAIKAATMEQLLTGRTRLPQFAFWEDGSPKRYKSSELGEIPEDWDICDIQQSCDILTGHPFPSEGYSLVGFRLLRGANIKRDRTDWSEQITSYWPEVTADLKEYELKSGDIVISMDGSLVGKSFAQLTGNDLPALLLQRVARLRAKTVYQSYLKEWICSSFFIDHCDSLKTVTAIPHISPQDIKSFKFVVPRCEREQINIATVLSELSEEVLLLEKRLDKTRQLKQGMMQQLLTGKIRLVKPSTVSAS